MTHGFDTDDPRAAAAALLVYAAWRSRDKRRFKITPDVWSQVERSVKASAKRAATLPGFLERLMPRLLAGSVNPAYCRSDWEPLATVEHMQDGSVIERAGGRVFLTRLLAEADTGAVLATLYRETVLVVLLVRERLEREHSREGEIDRAAELHLATPEEIAAAYAEDEAAGVYR